jgi:hypothetical protein
VSDEATNPVAEEELVSAPAAGVADEANAQGDDQSSTPIAELDDDGNPIEAEADAEGDEDPDAEEIEHNGKKYKVPKDLKEGNLRQDDYTRKTQTLAEERRAFEAERATGLEQKTLQQAEFIQAMREDVGKVHLLETEVKKFETVDWRAAQQQIAMLAADPNRFQEAQQAQSQYNLAWSQFTAAERDLTQAKSALTEKEQRLSQEQTQRVQATMRETVQTLQRDIPGFTPDLANKIVDHAMKAFGLQPEEARQMNDPRVWKLIHSDFAKASEIEKLKAENGKLKGQKTAQTSNAAAQQVKPAVQVRGSAPANSNPRDDQPMDDWVKSERARMARKAAR